ncbi:hypothetical protein L1887_18468 [Cichorium endivia]|nr:hypothetical protein L1887_18468 [Cichorium endivia]
MDPLYAERSRLTKESDVYSFGVVMFEMSSGTLVYREKCFGDDDKPQYLMDVVRSCYDDDKKASGPEKLIDPFIKDHTDMESFHTFNKIAHECVTLKLEQRPTMERIIRKIQQALNIQLGQHESPSTITTRSLESFLIPLKEINLATENFNLKTCPSDPKPGRHISRLQKSDMYSFGVIMFEMLSGWRAYELSNIKYPEDQINLLQQYYHNNELDQFIDYNIRDQIDSRCLNIFKEIAYQCIMRDNQTRPSWMGPFDRRDPRASLTMDKVIERLEDAADFQVSPCLIVL